MENKVDDLFLLIESHRNSFTSVEQNIADYFISKQEVLSISELAKKISVSPPSITRFCKKLGLNNFKELIFLYSLSLNDQTEDASNISTPVTASYHALATRSDAAYRSQAVENFCDLIDATRIIMFWGLGFNSFAGNDFEFKFARFGKVIQVYSDQHSISLSASSLQKGDLVLIASLRGQDKDMLEAVKVGRTKGAKFLMITSNEDSPIVDYCEETVYAANFSADEALGNISPQIPVLIQLDIIYSKYVKKHKGNISKWVQSENILKR
ncbi:MurR/RpiR family transcriptional regulator [Companilactobacillus allii]|uniref:Transcriptional regulator n=1 Tax=Companilactobacillus allii TaxID=1847728 RepID=A0A1P8Q0K9_9LACO|nr:MurR/RpiR family transcriptional regulator [Companilactobacillus allii]APX71412.1 transcriptional regulator [Companilactobacillus allii]USQ68492.1 MurR/RpiR family transcriptional regulator [Companilactobacillus allii]